MTAQNPSQTTPEFTFLTTDPDLDVLISMDQHVRDNRPTPHRTSIRAFFESLSKPHPTEFRKDGPGWYNGHCVGRRRKENFKEFAFAVLDADSSVLDSGALIDGAPNPQDVHEALVALNVTHHIYTTYSHGSWKGSRYRLIFPVETHSPGQLKSALVYLHDLVLQADLPLALSRESYTVPNRWHLPRVEHAGAPFYAATHYGFQLSNEATRYLALHYQQADEQDRPVIGTVPPYTPILSSGGAKSILDAFCDAFRMEGILAEAGYTFHGYTLMTDPAGRDVQAMRYRKPNSSSEPGVVVFEVEGKQRVYSHHQNDPLANGHANDVFDAYMTLNQVPPPNQRDVAMSLLTEHEVEKMNATFPSILVSGSKFRYATIVQGDLGSFEYRFLTPVDFHHIMRNQPGVFRLSHDEDGSKVVVENRGKWWETCPGRILYKNAVFQPKPMVHGSSGAEHFHLSRAGEPYFNLFSGWPTQPRAGRWDMLEWHMRHVLCGSDEGHFEYLLDWLAHMVQYPEQKPNVAVVLRGRKGTGKSIIMSALARSLGPLGTVIAHSRHFTGSFNAHFRNKIFALIEESFFSGSPSEEAIIKHMISDVETTYEAKGYDAESGQSFLRICLITNSDWAAPATEDERRFFVPTVSQAAIERNGMEEGHYFARLAQELGGGGLPALFHHLTQRRIDPAQVRKAPDSQELARQKLLTLKGTPAWLFDTLVTKRFTGRNSVVIELQHTPRYNELHADDVLDALTKHVNGYEAARSQLYRLTEYLKQVFPSMKLDHRANGPVLVLPGLEDMRAQFCGYYKVEYNW